MQLQEEKSWYENGQLKYQIFHRDKLEGECKFWHENGQLWEHAFFQNGKLEGKWRRWHSNGQLRDQRFYRDNKLDGADMSWYENGWIFHSAFYVNGKTEGESTWWWYEMGKLRCVTREFRVDGKAIDWFFSRKKKHGFLHIKRCFKNRALHVVNDMLISDLTNMIRNFISS